MRHCAPVLILLLMLLTCLKSTIAEEPVSSSEPDFKPLFNGKDFTGFKQLGGKAIFEIENGDTIVGRTVVGEPNTFLATEKNYRNFILELDVKVGKMNAGIQVRSNVYTEPTTVEEYFSPTNTRKHTYPAGTVHGYQIEIEPSPKWVSGAVFDECRRGWLQDLKGDEHKAAQAAFKPDDWNHYKISLIGDHIQTWINGVPCADVRDSLTADGFIALQVHSEKEGGLEVRYRNIMIKELPDDATSGDARSITSETTMQTPVDAEGYLPYFNGKDFTGLTQLGGKATFEIEDENTILGKTVKGQPNSFLATEKMYRNFIMELDVKTTEMNAGIQVRSNQYVEDGQIEMQQGDKTVKKKVEAGRVHGYQVEVDPSPRAYSGGVYDEARRGWLYTLASDQHTEARQAFKVGEWNHYKIHFVGDHLQTWINGVPCADLHDDMTAEGFIALQVHSNPKSDVEVRYRNVKIKELPDDRSVDYPTNGVQNLRDNPMPE